MNFLFTLLVDVIPAHGRTEEEAKQVVWYGEKALSALEMNKRPSVWTEQSVQKFASLDWIQAIFFKEKVLARLTYIKNRYDELDRQFASGDQLYPYNEWAVRDLLEKDGMEPTKFEKFICNKMFRAMMYPYLMLLLFILFDPLHS